MNARRIRVNWDTSGDDGMVIPSEEVGLPEIVEVPGEIIEAEAGDPGSIADWLSDQYGFCVNGIEILP